jgi:diguanylate cyclase (GGDEF)-like protein
VHDDDGRLTHYLGYQIDVTARVEAEQRLVHLAGHDALTGLANRATLRDRLQAAVHQDVGGRAAAVLYLDLDGFKAVNDAHGHAVGDRVLVEVSERLRGVLRETDLLARLGGDEFVVLLGDLDPLDAARVADRVAHDASPAWSARSRPAP